jgi:hypothetical protein
LQNKQTGEPEPNVFFVYLQHKNPLDMSILNTSKDKDKKKGNQNTGKPGFAGPKGKSNTNSKAAAKNTRITGRSQRGS